MKRIAAALMIGRVADCQTMAPVADGPQRVTTTSGVLVDDTLDGQSMFKDVPFARPPLDALSWAPPQKMSWKMERAATCLPSAEICADIAPAKPSLSKAKRQQASRPARRAAGEVQGAGYLVRLQGQPVGARIRLRWRGQQL